MPKEYLYCAQCQSRLSNEDFHRCFEIRGRLVCDGCVTEAMAPLSLKEQEEILLMIREARDHPPPVPRPEPLRIQTGRTSQRLRAVQAPLAVRPLGATPAPAVPRATPHRTPVGAILTLVSLLVVAGIVVLFLNQPKSGPAVAAAPPPPRKPAERPKKKPKTPAPAAKTDAAPDALRSARAFVRDFPDDLSGQAAEWQKALFALDGTPHAEAARAEWEALRKAHLAAIAEQLAALDREIAPLVEREEFKKALAALEAARARHEIVDWAKGVDLRTRDLGAATWKAFQPLKHKAADAKRRAAQGEIDVLKERIAKWGLDSFVRELDHALATAAETTAPPAPAPPAEGELSPEAKAYRALWDKALEPARTRNYAAAVSALEKATGDEAKEDLELLKAAAAAVEGAKAVLASWPRGSRVTLELIGETLELERVSEPFVQAVENGVQLLRGGWPSTVDFEDIAARSLGELWRSRPGAAEGDAKIAALVCLLEGDAIGARRQLGAQPSDLLPARYWRRAARLADERVGPEEIEARKLWFAAERENASGRTRAEAVAKYRALLNEHAATALVRSRRERIVKRRDAGREYVFTADDLAGAGSLKLSRHPKAGPCWISMADAPPSAAPQNYVEFQFYALPDEAYRAWIYAAGCCQENFDFSCQTTDLTVPDPGTKALLRAEPGGGAPLPVKHSIPFLKSRHELHGGPKEARRWEWIALPLPKYTAGGLKTVRLLTNQKGFGAACAVVSAVRTSPPGEAEMKSWIKAEPDPVAEAPVEKDPALVGHWKLDETSGATALDSSGGDNTAVLAEGAAGGASGRLGGALTLDGKDAHAAVPNSPALARLQEGSYTISAWFRPASRPPGKSPRENGAYYAIVMKTGLHEGLKYGADQRFAMDHWLADNTGAAAVSGTTFPPGAWYHVAGVVSRPEGIVRVYVNGRLEGTHQWAPDVAPRDYGSATWKIGIGAPGASELRWAADGAIDDVRLYSRALHANEIRALAGGAAAAVLPSVAITSPGPGETYEAGSTIPLAASVTGFDKVLRIDFLLGGTVVATDTSAPWSASWPKVPSGVYSLVARATLPDKNAPPALSKPLTVRVGDVSLHRAINLGSPQRVIADGVTFEPGSGAPNLSINGRRVEQRELELTPPPLDGQQGALLRSGLSYRDGVVATLVQVPNGAYQVYLYVWEDDENTTFDILLEEKVVQARYASGPAGSWAKLGPWTVDVTDGSLQLAIKGGPANFAAIEAWKVSR